MKIVLGIPVMYVVPGQALASMLALAATLGRRGEVYVTEVLNVIPYDKAREKVVETATAVDADYIMFVDSDMVVPSNAFDLLYESMQAGAQVASGHYYKRGYPFTSNWLRVVDDKVVPVVPVATDGIMDLDGTGLGCTLIDFKWVQKHFSAPVFSMTSPEGRFCPEDLLFCWKVNSAGGRVVGDARVSCGHIGHSIVVDGHNATVLADAWEKEHPDECIR